MAEDTGMRAQPGPVPEPPGPTVKQLALLAVPALLVGVMSAFTLWLLNVTSEWIIGWVWTDLPASFGATESTPWWILLVLTLTGLAVGLVVWLIPGHAGPDSATTELASSALPTRVLPGIALAALLGLAGGVSLGPENPILAINAGLAVALLARASRMIPPKLVVLMASAGTIGALFGTPVAAALAFTGIVGALRTGGSLWDKLFVPLAAGGAGAVTMHLLGQPPLAFEVAPMGAIEAGDLATGLVVALASTLIGLLAAWLLPIVHRAFHALRHPVLVSTAGGAVLGLLGILGGPITMFKGLDQSAELIQHPGDYDSGQLALFTVVKVAALLVAASAGFRGGRIFPSVFIGVAIGMLGSSLIPSMPVSLAIAAGVLGITLVATRDGWIALFVSVAMVGDTTVLPILTLVILPIWLFVTKGPELVVKPRESRDAEPHGDG